MSTENVKDAPEAKAETSQDVDVTNVGQAIHVLIQAADLGRKNGIFDWNDLKLISQSISLLAPTKEDESNGPDIDNVATEG